MMRIASAMMARMDLDARQYPYSYEQALNNVRPVFESSLQRPLQAELDPLKARPKLVEAYQLALEERWSRSSLKPETLTTIDRVVEAALPAAVEDVEGFHDRPEDPIEDFTFVGTRYAYRVTEDMIKAIRQEGYDDLGILDLAIAVAEANQWARLHRLLGLKADLFYSNYP